MSTPKLCLTTGKLFSLIVALAAATGLTPPAAAQAASPSARWLAAPVAEVRAAAEKGEAAAQHALGERLLRGRDGKADLLAAYDWFARAGSNGVVEAQLRMGMKHERAVNTVRELGEAARWYQLAAAQGSEAARFRLACLHSLNRYRGKLDGHETARWLQPLVERRHPLAVQLMRTTGGALLATNMPPAQLQAWLVEAAEAGGVVEQRQLAERLVGSDPKAAAFWWEVSRLGGNTNVSFVIARAQARLSDAELAAETARAKQFKPKPVPSSTPLAGLDALHHLEVELQPTVASRAELAGLEQAAKIGSAEAQFQLALIHQLAPAFTNHLAALDRSSRWSNGILMNNDRVPQPHLDEAVRWHTAAAKQGHRDAALCLAWLLHSGVLGSTRTVEAMPWFKVAVDAGHAESAYLLYQLHRAGHGHEKSSDPTVWARQRTESMNWLQKAATMEFLPAQLDLAAVAHGQGDQTTSLRLLRAAAARGDTGAKVRLREWFGLTDHAAAPATTAAATKPVGSPRLAIVPLAEGLRPLADLLLAELSTQPGVTLLERAELERVFREQSLNAANTSALKLGELLNAQGLVLLETNAPAGAAVANIRFVAVGPGVLLSGASVPLPLTNALDVSQQLATQFTPWLGKLAVPRSAAVPVSLLGLRMATTAADGPELENGLSLLFLHRLAREREVFALERRRLEQLAAEQELVGTANNFWSGGALVEGAIERDVNDRTRLNVRLQVTPAGGARVSAEAAGSTTNLAALADALTGQLLAALKKTPAATWNPQEEAIVFFQEASWQARWSQWAPALAAMESAWALGLRGPSHAQARQQLLLTNFRFVKLRRPADGGYPAQLRQPPAAENLDHAARAIAAFTSHTRSLPPASLTNHAHWLALGVVTLELAGKTLEEFYLAPEHRAGRTEQLTQLRAEARELHAYLVKLRELPGIGTDGGRRDLNDHLFGRTLPGGNFDTANLLRLDVSYGRYWATGPEAVLELHQRLQARSDYEQWRHQFEQATPTPLVAWTPAERAALPALWAAHLRNLASPTNLPGLFEQELRALRAVPSSPWQTAEPNLKVALGKWLDFAWTHRNALARHAAGAHTVSTTLATARSPFSFYHGSTGAEPAGARLEALVAGQEKRFRAYQAEHGLEAAMTYLRDTKPGDPAAFMGDIAKYTEAGAKFDDLVVQPAFTATQLKELLPLAKAFADRFGPFYHPPGVLAGLGKLTDRAALAVATNAPVVPPTVAKDPPATTGAAPTPGTPSPDALRVTRFWLAPELRRPAKSFYSFPLPADHSVESQRINIHEWTWAEGRLWLAWRHDLNVRVPGEGYARQACSHVAGYSLPEFAGDSDPAPLPPEVELTGEFRHLHTLPEGRIAVAGGQTFIAGSNTVWRVTKGANAPLKLEVNGEPLLAVAHGRLLISVPDELYAYDVTADKAELLASGRRRPATNPADSAALGLGQVAELPGQRMRVFFTRGGSLDYDFASHRWTPAPTAPGMVRRAHGELWTTTTTGNNYSFLHVLWPAATNWQLAALRLPPPPNELSFFMTQSRLPGVPQWSPQDRSLSPAGLAATAQSNRFWTVTGLDFHQGHTNQDTFMLSTNGSHVRLAVWRAELTQPAVIPLWLELPAGSLSRLGVGLARSRSFSGKLAAAPGALLATPPGLVYRAEAVPGFWFIPWSEIMPRVEEQFARLAAALAARPEPGNHRGRQLLHRYDLDGDGKVGGAEFATLYSGEKLDTDGNRARFEVSSRFQSADRNRSGDLDAEELLGFADLLRARSSGAPQPGFGPPGFRPPGFPTGPTGFPPGAGMPPRPGQMPSGPPPPEILERYDKNKNGKLDPDEMQEFLREMMSGKSPRPRGTNVPPGAPTPKAPPPQP